MKGERRRRRRRKKGDIMSTKKGSGRGGVEGKAKKDQGLARGKRLIWRRKNKKRKGENEHQRGNNGKETEGGEGRKD